MQDKYPSRTQEIIQHIFSNCYDGQTYVQTNSTGVWILTPVNKTTFLDFLFHHPELNDSTIHHPELNEKDDCDVNICLKVTADVVGDIKHLQTIPTFHSFRSIHTRAQCIYLCRLFQMNIIRSYVKAIRILKCLARPVPHDIQGVLRPHTQHSQYRLQIHHHPDQDKTLSEQTNEW